MRLHELAPNPGSHQRKKRVGCGESSGHGKTSGRGHKGQKSRAGAAIRNGFEGGQMPLYRRIPRKGFNNKRFRDVVAVVNLSTLEERFETGVTIDAELLTSSGLINRRFDAIKVLGNGDVTKAFTLKVDAISASAKEKIEKAGGSVTLPEAS